MTATHAVLGARRRSARRVLRDDKRRRVIFITAIVFNLAAALWSAHWLAYHVAQWRAAGPHTLQTQLWALFLRLWAGFGLFAALETMQTGFAADESILLITLPLPTPVYFRALYATVLLQRLGLWLLFLAAVLVVTLGLDALPWLILGLVGMGLAAACGVIGALLIARHVVPRRPAARILILLFGIGWGLVLGAFLGGWITTPWHDAATPSPIEAVGPLSVLLITVVGPLADPLGALYVAAFQAMQGREGSRATRASPWPRLPIYLPFSGSITGALIAKEILTRARAPLTWVRVAFVLLCLPLFPWARSLAAAYNFSTTETVVGYVTGVTLLALIDAAPSPLGSEGNRLTLYLTAPLGLAHLLRAKLAVFLLPALGQGLILTLALDWWVRLKVGQLLPVVATVLLIALGVAALHVWGSAWDEDIDQPVDGALQTLLVETLPLTPRRLALIALDTLLLAGMLALVRALPSALALSALVLCDAVIIGVLWHLSNGYLRRQLE